MKKLLLLISLFFLIQNVFGQKEFAPIGATWYYNKTENIVGELGYVKIISKKDTVVNEKACKLLSKTYYSSKKDTVPYGNYIVHQSGDSIFYWLDEGFKLVYDFSLEVGDSMYIYSPELLCPDDSSHWGEIVVDSITYTTINSFELKTMHTSPTTNSNYLYAAPFVEIIGSLSYLLPLDTGCGICDQLTEFGRLRCYNDSIIGYKNFYFDYPCDTTYSYVSVENVAHKPQATVIYNTNYKAIDITLNS
ncbi:MAG: hypothetical protein KAI79_14700, partial [Bacteroidales bacterium]|nr:hypothetical protein [Bacteroidales bacterium]